MVGLVRVVPIVFFSLLSGVAADVLDRRKLMLLTQTVMAVARRGAGDPDLARADVGLAGLRDRGGELRGRARSTCRRASR